MAVTLTGEPKYEAAEKQKWISFEMLIQMMWKIAECYEADGKVGEAITETAHALSLIELLEGDCKIVGAFQNYVDYFNKQIEHMKKI